MLSGDYRLRRTPVLAVQWRGDEDHLTGAFGADWCSKYVEHIFPGGTQVNVRLDDGNLAHGKVGDWIVIGPHAKWPTVVGRDEFDDRYEAT